MAGKMFSLMYLAQGATRFRSATCSKYDLYSPTRGDALGILVPEKELDQTCLHKTDNWRYSTLFSYDWV